LKLELILIIIRYTNKMLINKINKQKMRLKIKLMINYKVNNIIDRNNIKIQFHNIIRMNLNGFNINKMYNIKIIINLNNN